MLAAAVVGCCAVVWGDSAVGVEDEVGLTVCWFEGRMFSDGSDGIAGGGMSFEDCRRAARGRGEAGTELRSGIL